MAAEFWAEKATIHYSEEVSPVSPEIAAAWAHQGADFADFVVAWDRVKHRNYDEASQESQVVACCSS